MEMFKVPCAMTSGSPTDFAIRSFQWVPVKSEQAAQYRIRSTRPTKKVRSGRTCPTTVASKSILWLITRSPGRRRTAK